MILISALISASCFRPPLPLQRPYQRAINQLDELSKTQNAPVFAAVKPGLTDIPLLKEVLTLEEVEAAWLLKATLINRALVFGRTDSPLLLPPWENSLDYGSEETLNLVADIFANAEPDSLEQLVTGKQGLLLNALPIRSQNIIKSAFGPLLSEYPTGLPDVAQLFVVLTKQVVLVEPSGTQHILVYEGPTKPFNPKPYRDQIMVDEEARVPRELGLQYKTGALKLPISGSLGELLTSINTLNPNRPKLEVDRRAAKWRFVTAGFTLPQATSQVLTFAATSHNLYWRKVGSSWFLSSSPFHPDSHALAESHRRQQLALYNLLSPLCPVGLLSESLFAWSMKFDRRRINELSGSGESFLTRILLRGGKPKNSDEFKALVDDKSRLGNCRLIVSITPNLTIQIGSTSITRGFGG